MTTVLDAPMAARRAGEQLGVAFHAADVTLHFARLLASRFASPDGNSQRAKSGPLVATGECIRHVDLDVRATFGLPESGS